MYDPFKDYTEVNPSKPDEHGFLCRVKNSCMVLEWRVKQ